MIPRTTSSRWLAGAAVLVGLLIVFSVVIAVLNRESEPDLLPAGSPERAVQDYILAVQREDGHAAYALLNEEVRSRCDPDALSAESFQIYSGSFSTRLLRTKEGADEAVVTIKVTEVDTPEGVPLFGGSVSDYDRTYRLIREQGEWRLRHFGWPAWGCPRKAMPIPTATTTAQEP